MATATAQLTKELAVIKSETAPTLQMAASLKVVDHHSYAQADAFLTRLVSARKQIKARLSRFLDPLKEAVDKAREAYKEAQAFHEEVDQPLAFAEAAIRGSMKVFQIEEARKKRELEAAQEAEADRLRQEAEKKRQAELKAKTEPMRQKLAAQRAELETQAAVATAAPVAAPVKAAGSSARVTYKPEMVDPAALLKAWACDGIDMKDVSILDIFTVNQGTLKAVYRVYPEMVAAWPGVKIVEDIQIVHRGR